MKTTIELNHNSKACVWINDSPLIVYPFIDVITQELQTGLTQKYQIRKASLEITNNSGILSLEVCVSTESESIFSESIAAQLDIVRIGLPSEYSQSVINGVRQLLNSQLIETLGSGIVRFDKAAHGEASSS